MTKKSRNIIVCCVGVLVIVGLIYIACASKGASTGHVDRESASAIDVMAKVVSVTPVELSTINESTNYPGIVHAFQTANLTFRVGGPLIEIKVSPGDRVKAGDVLMQIDPRDFKNDVDVIESQLEAAQARFEAMKTGARPEDILLLEATVESAESMAEFAAQEFERIKTLYEKNVASKAEFEQAQHNHIAAKSALQSAKQELAKGKAGARAEDIVATKADIKNLGVQLQIAKNKLKDTTLCAPFEGVVTNKMIENFEMVTTQPTLKEVIVLHDLSKLKVRVFLPENELIRRSLTKNFEANIAFTAAQGKTYIGKLYEIDTQSRSAGGVYPVTFVMDAPKDLNVLPGMIAEVMIASDAALVTKQLTVPASAVLGDGIGDCFVWCIDSANSTATKKSIKRGELIHDNHYVVLSGLNEGEQVITDGNRFLAEGVNVNVEP